MASVEETITHRLEAFVTKLKEKNDKLEKIRAYCLIAGEVSCLSHTDKLKWNTCLNVILDPKTDADDRAMTTHTMLMILEPKA